MIPGKKAKGMGGAMDLVAGAGREVVMMEHTTADGSLKLLKDCTLPLTGMAVVDRVITNLGVLDPSGDGFVVTELAPGVRFEEIQAVTGAPLMFAAGVKELLG
jgi:3-oxoacid CoA-transferase subunit B